jgi:ubiquinone/menaquinone biosynthesis C-methylase UbiE
VSADAFKAFETGAWHDRARTYDLVVGAVTARVGEELLDAVGAGPGVRLLDVGCGPGTITAAAVARGARAVGVDLAAGMLQLGRERHPGLDLREGDAEALPFAEETFDAVVGGFVLNHLPDVDAAIAEAARVLAPRGRIAVAVWEPPERNPLLGELTAAVHDAGLAVRGGLPEGPDPYRLARHDRMCGLLAAVGPARARSLRLVHEAASADDLWHGLLGGTARISTVLAAQPPDVVARVREAFAARVAPSGGPVALEAAVTIGCATVAGA